MDRILSARVNEAIIKRIGALAKQLGTSKKAVIERAILAFAEKIESENDLDLLAETAGAWSREETVDVTVERSKRTFRERMKRHHE